ncbi:MAG: tripartite tricarboxylate transporter TctB family protein [Sulfuritalea sp.]|jgi:putative tricarboxylic transport membrane protein|nr:tripartite tricarboxylate transporter TctB family protein [Sulfuritalea sp.]
MSDQQITSNAPAKGAGPDNPARPGLRSDQKIAAGVVALALVTYWVSTTFDEVPAALTQGVPPESYPQLLLGVMIVLAGVLAFQARGRTDKVKKRIKPVVSYTAAVLIVATLSIHWLGIFGAMAIGCIVIPLLWGERRYVAIGLYTILLPLAVYGLFHTVLEVQFPLGIFQNMF